MEKEKAKWIAIGGIGIVGIGAGALLYMEHIKRAAIEDYVSEAKELENKYKELGADGEISEDDKRIIQSYIDALRIKEEYIKGKGWLIDLINAIAVLFGVATAYKVTPQVVQYIMKRWPPKKPEFKCPIDGEKFESEYQLKKHMEEEHPVKENTDAAYNAFTALPEYLQETIATISAFYSGMEREARQRWDSLPEPTRTIVLLAIAIACAIIIVYTLGAFALELSPIITGIAAA
jgi:hypothetical protein